MKLSQINSERDQNDIESQYLWNLKRQYYTEELFRINLHSLKINFSFSKSQLSQIHITNWIALPNNQIFGRYEENDDDMSYLFIADENGNIKIIKSPSLQITKYDCFASCYYDDSIFIFARGMYAERYFIRQNRWISLNKLPIGLPDPRLCIGFNQKIIIRQMSSYKMWVYDINLDSYSDNLLLENYSQFMIKDAGKIYSISLECFHTILYSFNPFTKWWLAKNYDQIFADFDETPSAYFNGSIFYLRRIGSYVALNEFSLKTFKSKVRTSFLEVRKFTKKFFLKSQFS